MRCLAKTPRPVETRKCSLKIVKMNGLWASSTPTRAGVFQENLPNPSGIPTFCFSLVTTTGRLSPSSLRSAPGLPISDRSCVSFAISLQCTYDGNNFIHHHFVKIANMIINISKIVKTGIKRLPNLRIKFQGQN